MDLTLQIKDMLMTFMDLRVGIIVLGLTQLAKLWLPDNIEGKVIPGIAAVIGIVASLFVHVDIVKGLITALLVSGVFGSLKDIMSAAAPKQ